MITAKLTYRGQEETFTVGSKDEKILVRFCGFYFKGRFDSNHLVFSCMWFRFPHAFIIRSLCIVSTKILRL